MPADVATDAAPAVAVGAPCVELGFGEALVRQSSGRHRAQPVLGVGVGARLHGPWGVELEATGSVADERSGELSLNQYFVRPAVLATLTFARGRSALELGLGPAMDVTVATWIEPAIPGVVAVEPAARARAALAMGVGAHLHVRIQGGLAARPSGVDDDFQLGASWAF
jgi:hypothetical protein